MTRKIVFIMALFTATLFTTSTFAKASEVSVEWAPFSIGENVTDKEIMASAELLQKEFIGKQKGFIKRELLKRNDNLWVDLIYWSSDEAAKRAVQNAKDCSSCMMYFKLMVTPDPETSKAGFGHYKIMASWN